MVEEEERSTEGSSSGSSINLVDVYRSECERLHCHPNSQFYNTLLAILHPEELQTIDLRRNFAGPLGCLAILTVAAHAPNLETMYLEGNQLNNTFVDVLSQYLIKSYHLNECDNGEGDKKKDEEEHAGPKVMKGKQNVIVSWRKLRLIDLSHNSLTTAGGKKLLAAVMLREKKLELEDSSGSSGVVPLSIVVADNYVIPFVAARLGRITDVVVSSTGSRPAAEATHPQPSLDTFLAIGACGGSFLLRGQGAQLLYELLMVDLQSEIREGKYAAVARLFEEWGKHENEEVV